METSNQTALELPPYPVVDVEVPLEVIEEPRAFQCDYSTEIQRITTIIEEYARKIQHTLPPNSERTIIGQVDNIPEELANNGEDLEDPLHHNLAGIFVFDILRTVKARLKQLGVPFHDFNADHPRGKKEYDANDMDASPLYVSKRKPLSIASKLAVVSPKLAWKSRWPSTFSELLDDLGILKRQRIWNEEDFKQC